MRPPDFKRISKEDFPQEYQGLIDQLAFPINSFSEQCRNLLNKNIDFQNLNQEVKDITVTVDVDGVPLILTQFKSNLNTRVRGMNCINVTNNTNPGTPPTNTPFATFTQGASNIVTINNIKGLAINTQYVLTFLVIGKDLI